MESNEAPTPAKSTFRLGMEYGLYVGLSLSVLSLLFVVFGRFESSVKGWLEMILMVAGIIYFTKDFRDQYAGGLLSYGKGVELGVYIALVSGLVYCVFSYILYKFIDPGLVDAMRQNTEEQLRESEISEEQVEQAMKFTKIFLQPLWLAMVSWFSMFFTQFIIALIVPIFLKRSPDATGDQ